MSAGVCEGVCMSAGVSERKADCLGGLGFIQSLGQGFCWSMTFVLCGMDALLSCCCFHPQSCVCVCVGVCVCVCVCGCVCSVFCVSPVLSTPENKHALTITPASPRHTGKPS